MGGVEMCGRSPLLILRSSVTCAPHSNLTFSDHVLDRGAVQLERWWSGVKGATRKEGDGGSRRDAVHATHSAALASPRHPTQVPQGEPQEEGAGRHCVGWGVNQGRLAPALG